MRQRACGRTPILTPAGVRAVYGSEIPAHLSNAQALFRATAKEELQDVILFNAEDDPANTITPRLMAAGANLSRIHILTGVKEESGKSRSADLSATSNICEMR